jgi:hypothetical protein
METMSIAKEILLDELNEQTHPVNVEDVIFLALEAYANTDSKTKTVVSWEKVVAYSIIDRILEAEEMARATKEY